MLNKQYLRYEQNIRKQLFVVVVVVAGLTKMKSLFASLGISQSLVTSGQVLVVGWL